MVQNCYFPGKNCIVANFSPHCQRLCFIALKGNAIHASAFDHYVLSNAGLPTKMGCVSSKIMTKSASFREELNLSLRSRRGTDEVVDEITITKNDRDHQLLALLCTANAVALRLKESSPAQEPSERKNPSVNSNSNSIGTQEAEGNDIETINSWELLDGLEDDDSDQNASNDSVGPSRGFRTVEDFDALMAANNLPGIDKEAEEEGRLLVRDDSREKGGSKRKALAKELTALKVPGFEFTRGGSLREWLSQGGQVLSPGSYVTPKFGNFVCPGTGNDICFDPELVEQFEQAMERLTTEEESIIQEIIASLEGAAGQESISFRCEKPDP